MLGLRLPLSLRMIDGFCGTTLLLLPCPGPGLYTHISPCFFHVALHFFVYGPSSSLRNKSPYIQYIFILIYMYVLSVVYIIFFHSCLSFCVMRFSLLRFGPHVPCVSVCACPVRVIKKQPPLRHIKAFPGIKISHQPRLATIPIPIPPSNHPSIQLSTQSSVYPASQLSISSLAFRINA